MQEYKMAAVFGSPRRNGNTDMLLESFLRGLADSGLPVSVERIIISQFDISPCRECRYCSTDGECIVNDDMQKIYPKMIEADLIALASPVFFTTVSGYMKSFIDRFQRFWALKYELKKKILPGGSKKGLFFSCAGSDRPDIFDCPKKVVRSLFDVLYTDYYKDFCYNNIDFKDDIKKDPDICKTVYEFGKDAGFFKNI
jgi:hypothetical protein